MVVIYPEYLVQKTDSKKPFRHYVQQNKENGSLYFFDKDFCDNSYGILLHRPGMNKTKVYSSSFLLKFIITNSFRLSGNTASSRYIRRQTS